MSILPPNSTTIHVSCSCGEWTGAYMSGDWQAEQRFRQHKDACRIALAEALIAKSRAEAEALAAAEALIAGRNQTPRAPSARVNVRAHTRAAPGSRSESSPIAETNPRPGSVAAALAEQLEEAILAEAKRRVEKEKADEEARILAEAKRRLEAERAAAALRRSDAVEARIQAAMEALRKQ